MFCASDHPYHSFFTKDTEGKTITVDPAFLQEVMYVNENNVPEKDIHDLSHQWLEIRMADIDCVLDSVEEPYPVSLFAPPLAYALGTSTVDATACIETVNEMVLEYMNCYLMGSGES